MSVSPGHCGQSFVGVHFPRSRQQCFYLILKGPWDLKKVQNGWPRTREVDLPPSRVRSTD